MAAMQCTLRQDIEAHKYRSSPANQCIKSWWAVFQRNRLNWWIDFFKNLIEEDNFCPGNELQQECIWFCFNKLLQDNLEAFKDHWNTHWIRHLRHDTISGLPDELFFSSRVSRWCRQLALQWVSWFDRVLGRKLDLSRGEICTLNTSWQTHSWKCQTLVRKEFSCTKLYWIL